MTPAQMIGALLRYCLNGWRGGGNSADIRRPTLVLVNPRAESLDRRRAQLMERCV